MDILLENGDFLSLSRKQPQLFNQICKFTLQNGTKVKVVAEGVISFEPAVAGHKDIVLSCGIHGNETAPIEICDELVKNILTQKISLAHRVLFIFGNLPSIDIEKRFVEENLNRLFSGAHTQGTEPTNTERKRAKILEQAVAEFFLSRPDQTERIHYDLHTAIRASKNEKFAVYPFLHGKPHSKQQLAFLFDCGVNTILLSESPTTTFSYYSSTQFNAHAFTVELGKVRPFGQNDMSKFAQAKQAITELITLQHLHVSSFDQTKMLIYRVNQVINKNQPDFELNFDDETPNFSDFSKGDLLASESGKQYFCQQDGEAIVFPNAQVAIGQRAILTVIPCEI